MDTGNENNCLDQIIRPMIPKDYKNCHGMATKEDRRPYNGVCRVWIHSMRFVNPFTMCCRRSLLETVLLRFQFQAV